MRAIGIKTVNLEPMVAREALENGYNIGDWDTSCMGYEITYPDGYKSWCPKNITDSAYFKIEDKNADKISLKDIENFIAYSKLIKIGTKTTNITLTTITGFEVNGQSSCVKAEDHDLSIGAKYARTKAEDIIWLCLSFVLQWAKYGLNPKSKFAVDPDKQ